ncbi:TrbC/VirB2 family protein [Salmonella enterica]|nr:TrbC/VirB2 family protein [Salmonella enterica]
MNVFKAIKNVCKSLLSSGIVFAAPVMAASNAGFQKANDAISWWAVGLASLAVATITLCICYIGYKVLWNGKNIAEMTNVIVGGILIAGASGFAAWYAA